MTEISKYVGMDVHREKISVAVVDQGRRPARYWGDAACATSDTGC